MIKISLKGDIREFEPGIPLIDVAKSISEGLARNACCALVDGKMTDLRTALTADCAVEFCNFDTEEGRHAFRHTASHIMAQAVKRLYPSAKLAIGPAIDNGFYYDFDFETALTLEDLPAIEEEMKNGLVFEPVDPTPDSEIKGATWIKPQIAETYSVDN